MLNTTLLPTFPLPQDTLKPGPPGNKFSKLAAGAPTGAIADKGDSAVAEAAGELGVIDDRDRFEILQMRKAVR